MTGRASEWFVSAFGREYLRVYAHRSESAAAEEVEFVTSALALRDGDPLLDAGCGAGRHARALAAAGARVVGLDLSADLLTRAAAASGGPAYVRGDLRALPFQGGAFAHVVSLFTSFGYFSDEGNAAQLAGFRRVVRPGGRLLLDYLNAAHVRATLVPRSERREAGVTVTEERCIRDGRVEKDVRVLRDGEAPLAWTESVRLYERAEMEELVRDAGFEVRGVWGDLSGGAWSVTAPRTVVVGTVA